MKIEIDAELLHTLLNNRKSLLTIGEKFGLDEADLDKAGAGDHMVDELKQLLTVNQTMKTMIKKQTSNGSIEEYNKKTESLPTAPFNSEEG